MKLTIKSSKLTYKTLFGYSLVIITLLVVAVPVFANTRPGNQLLDLSFRSDVGSTPHTAHPLSQGANLDHLSPGEEDWYSYGRHTFESSDFSWISLALRYQSEAVLDADQVNFEVLAQPQAGSWFQTSEAPQEVLGVGLRSPLRASPSLIESFWTGHVAQQQLYYVRVFNNSPFSLDYTLDAKAEQPAVSGATPASFGAAMPNPETVNARQLAWTLTAQAVENMDAGAAARWMQQAQAVGWLVTAGTAAADIPNPAEADSQLLWSLTARAIEGQAADAASRWLIQADSLGWLSIPLNTLKNPNLEETGGSGGDGGGNEEADPPAAPIPPQDTYQPVNIYPNNPLAFDPNNLNSGRLAPYGEHWYSLLRDDLDQNLIEDMAMTMFFTPLEGFMSNRINFEIIPAGQYHIWERGDADYMENIGAGMWVSRDEDPHTGERLWSGSLVDGDRYLIKIKNGTADVVDYYLFPGDIENGELGNPTLHQGDSSWGRVPYAPSPPTRPGSPPEPGAGPPEAIPLEVGATTGALQAGMERWYRFYFNTPAGDDSVQHFTFYLTNTPAGEERARHADFAIYPGNQLQIWTRGTIDKLEPLGTSSPSPYKTEDVKSLQVLWDGYLMAHHVYYVKVFNHDIGPLEYELVIKGG
ncbi:MAG: hypothetical protein AB1801_22520 [Chloroflexota bacterium]